MLPRGELLRRLQSGSGGHYKVFFSFTGADSTFSSTVYCLLVLFLSPNKFVVPSQTLFSGFDLKIHRRCGSPRLIVNI